MELVSFIVLLLLGLSPAQELGDSQGVGVTHKECSQGVTNCSACLQKPNCVWCADPPVNGKVSARCGSVFSPEECKSVEYLVQHSESSPEGHTYISPKTITMRLRKDKPMNVTIKYNQAMYPVDLYILLDHSWTMRLHKEKLSRLGSKIAAKMKLITTDFRLGFGSFVDKTVRPYARPLNVTEKNLGLVPTYGFKHHLRLTDNATLFEWKVRTTNMSSNIDNPEGGLEALVQAIVCEHIGWRKNSRKIIILATDGPFHAAGDGKLAGILTPNDGQCHLTKETNSDDYIYDWVDLQDYPSVQQLANLTARNRLNIIFAVSGSETNQEKYKKLAVKIQGASVALLTDDSTNILDVVKDEYKKISGRVELQDESLPKHISMRYFVKCEENGEFIEKRGCENVTKGQVLEFQVEVVLTKCEDNDWTDKFSILPTGIQEKVEIEVRNMCQCPCQQTSKGNSDICQSRGNLTCGICECNSPYSGNTCECDKSQSGTKGDQCIAPGEKSECSGRGTCKCGKCECKAQRYSGTFCECDNESCGRTNNELCSGKDQGTCYCGKCVCKHGWTGDKCDCPKDTSKCQRPGSSEICSGRGRCECNQCQCNSNDKGRFTGNYCENCPTCESNNCTKYEWSLYCSAFGKAPYPGVNCSIFAPQNFTWTHTEEKMNNEELCRSIDVDDCIYKFIYSEQPLTLRMIKFGDDEMECPKSADMMTIGGVSVGATLFVGLALIFVWRLLTYYHDKKEYNKFMEEQKKAKWADNSNPIYRGATTEFANPAYRK